MLVDNIDLEASQANVFEHVLQLLGEIRRGNPQALHAPQELQSKALGRIALPQQVHEQGAALREQIQRGVDLLADPLDRHHGFEDQYEVRWDLQAIFGS